MSCWWSFVKVKLNSLFLPIHCGSSHLDTELWCREPELQAGLRETWYRNALCLQTILRVSWHAKPQRGKWVKKVFVVKSFSVRNGMTVLMTNNRHFWRVTRSWLILLLNIVLQIKKLVDPFCKYFSRFKFANPMRKIATKNSRIQKIQELEQINQDLYQNTFEQVE